MHTHDTCTHAHTRARTCRQSALELERLTEKRRSEEEAWHRQQELLLEAEGQRRKLLELEEQKLSDQRARCVKEREEGEAKD